MKKLLQLLSTVFVVALLLLGCSTNDTENNTNETVNTEQTQENENAESDENAEDSVHIVVSEDKGKENEEIYSDENVEIEEGEILLEVMNDHFDVEDEDGFITSIDGKEQDEEAGKFWMYDVNGEMASVGANELELSPGDEVEFDLQAAE